MSAMLLSLLLALQMTLPALPAQEAPHLAQPPQAQRLWWGMLDPELSTWFARILPAQEEDEDRPVLWNWSWRGFLAALFGQPLTEEGDGDVRCV